MLFVGIDPGFSGAVAFYRPDVSKLHIYDLPINTYATTTGQRKEIDATRTYQLLRKYLTHPAHNIASIVMIEDVGAMVYTDRTGQVRGQGAAASFAFGKGTGILHGLLATFPTQVVPIKAAVWKALLGLSSDKKLSREKASFLFPDKRAEFKRVKDDGRAEAALLAYLAHQKFNRGEEHGKESRSERREAGAGTEVSGEERS